MTSSAGQFFTSRPPRQLGLLLASALLAAAAMQSAGASSVVERTTADNDSLSFGLGYLGGTHVASIPLGLAPPPADVVAEIAGYSAEVGMKFLPPPLSPPGDLELTPNARSTTLDSSAICVYRFEEALAADANERGIEEDYASTFFVPYNPLDDVWGDLGRPWVVHPSGDITVSVENEFLAGDIVHPEFPEGRHRLAWRADMYMNPVLDIALPTVLIPVSAYAESRIAKTAAAKLALSDGSAKLSAKGLTMLFELAIDAGLAAADEGISATEWNQRESVITARNRGTQFLTVWDIHMPFLRDAQTGSTGIEEQLIELEATDFGGVRFARVREELRARFEPVDRCGKPFFTDTDEADARLFPIGEESVVTWESRERGGGPYRTDVETLADNQRWVDGGENVITTLIQRIRVVDTQAPLLLVPPGFARYSETGIDLTAEDFPLGRPRVVDLADPAPQVTNDAGDFLAPPTADEGGRRYLVQWQATDASGNVTEASADDPDQYTQVVTLKVPGTNTAPTAAPASAATITSEPVEILLGGQDGDLIDGRYDPLDFRIENLPAHGYFEAPDYPFFIEDFRITPVGERAEGDKITRTSPLGELAQGFVDTLASERGTYLNQNVCLASPGTPGADDLGNVIPVDFVYQPTHVYVSDDNRYYIRDKFFLCGETPDLHLDVSGQLPAIPRISVWDENGEFLAMRALYPTADPAYDDTGLVTNEWPQDEFTVDHNGRFWVVFESIVTSFGQDLTFRSLDADLGDPRAHGSTSYNETDVIYGREVKGVVGESGWDLLYELHFNGVHVRPSTDDPDLSADEQKIGVLDDSGIATLEEDPDPPLDGSALIIGGLDLTETSLRGTDIAVDSEGHVYVLEPRKNRIHKWAPTTRDALGEWQLGEYIGWMGSCLANKADPDTGVPYNGCDEATGTTRGYACTDDTCTQALDGSGEWATAGSEPGQFDTPADIKIDPNDLLYVADTENLRVQRFGDDGTFAGQAESTGTGVNQGEEPGFILGNMGKPKRLSVNSSSFFVIEPDNDNGDDFVHVFKTLPFYDVTDDSAKVKYVSRFDFYDDVDAFSYLVDDGIDESAPATVTVSVDRAFRPPERLRSQCYGDETLDEPVRCELDEDGAIYVRLSSYDPDGFVSTGGLDTHTFTVDPAPSRGTLTEIATQDNSVVFRYTPEADYSGDDGFGFSASDGALSAEEPGEVRLLVRPVPDPVVPELPGDLKAARGFNRTVTAEYSDADEDPAEEQEVLSIAWGDGVVATGPDWTASGRRDLNDREIDPHLPAGPGTGYLVGSHTWQTTGPKALTVVMYNDPALGLENSVATTTVEVIDATVVTAKLGEPADPVQPDAPFPLRVEVTNLRPDGWAGLAAGNVRISIDIPEGLDLVSLDPRCSQGERLDCALGELAQGATARIELAAIIGLQAAREEQSFPLRTELFDDGPKIRDENVSVLSVSVADADNDGVIDVDDAFPEDPDYANDADGDGLPDEWEADYGFDPAVADDAASDEDGDGITLAGEYRARSFPKLAERPLAEAGARLSAPDTGAEDRFGQALAGGDFNDDGYADLVIGALLYDGAGAAFIALGSENGVLSELRELRPASGSVAYGRAVAAGDWNDSGYPDVAIASTNGIDIHYNNGEIYETPDRQLAGLETDADLGTFLASGDLDGDGIDDLLALSHVAGERARVYVYRSTTGGPDGAPLVHALDVSSASAAAVADIDGDGASDLLVGGGEKVTGYLGADNDWAAPALVPAASFELQALESASRFGFSIASGADIGGDGIADLVVGAYGGRGRIHVYDSTTAYWVADVDEIVSTTSPVQTIAGRDDGSDPGDTHGDQFGVRVALGHLDRDGYADVMVGANRGGLADAGYVQVYRGGPAGLTADPETGEGDIDYDMLGYYVAIPGDVDGDGVDDIAGGAPDIATAQSPNPDGGYVRIYRHALTAVDPGDDPDGDGVATGADNCPDTANTDQADLDGDGAGDACDTDIDGDGTSNEFDNCPGTASDDQSDLDGDGIGDACDDDIDGDGVANADDAFPRDERYSADTDGDGMPDAWEADNGLNPEDAGDADTDADGDGRSNADEFRAGGDPAADDVPPELTAPADVVVDAIGPHTPVELGGATASDARDGALTASPDRQGPFPPGRHIVTWRAADAAGNEAADTQQVDVLPLVNFATRALPMGEGTERVLTVRLNGPAPEYPVVVPYTVSGTATEGEDYEFDSGEAEIRFEGGGLAGNQTQSIIPLRTFADALPEPDETIVIRLGDPGNAVLGAGDEAVVTISEANLAPIPSIDIVQAGEQRTTVTADGGAVRVSVEGGDPNDDAVGYDWSASDGALVPSEGYDERTFTFDPAGVAAGTYRVTVTATDDGLPARSATVHRYLRVVPAAPALAADADRDGDGVDDAAEGIADRNRNGVSAWLDPSEDWHHLVAETGSPAILQAEEGNILSLGRTALASGDDARVTMTDIRNHGSDGGPASNVDDERYHYPLGIHDFEVRSAFGPADSARVVIPLPEPVPAGAVWRKYAANLGWQDFVEDARNALASAAGEPGICPEPGSARYSAGLTAGHHCVQLTLEDGGPNDADGERNGTIVDPGGIAIATTGPSVDAAGLVVADREVDAGAADVPLLRFELASATADVVLRRLTLRASGSGDDAADVQRVSLWLDANGDGAVDAGDTRLGSGTYAADDGTLNLEPGSPFELPQGTTRFLITYDF